MTYDAADDGRRSYDLAIAEMRKKLLKAKARNLNQCKKPSSDI